MQSEVQSRWQVLLARSDPYLPAAELYRGRSFRLAVRAAETLQADMGVISAGLGYVRGTTPVPPYDLTVADRASASVSTRVEGRFDPVAWWRSVAVGRYASDLVADLIGRPIVLICLSRNYAKMLAQELERMHLAGVPLRIFGLNIGSALPPQVRQSVLPYDERLSQVGLSGTRTDFAQRALVHYVESILPRRAGISSERELIAAQMSRGQARPSRHAQRLPDRAIKERILAVAGNFGGSKSRVLRHLRHVEGIACEQGRFSRLFAEVRSEGQEDDQ